MAVANNVLNAINVFSSTSVFNSNKGSVGANDLNFIKQTTAELATEGGGIIAQSLGTNGYVKFANGLILQWGKVDNLTKDKVINFFISYTTNPVIFMNTLANSNDNGGDAYANWVYGITSTSFVYNFYNTAIGTKKGLWVSIGQ